MGDAVGISVHGMVQFGMMWFDCDFLGWASDGFDMVSLASSLLWFFSCSSSGGSGGTY